MKVNTYANLKSPTVNETISIGDWLTRIQNPSPELLVKIEQARKYKHQYINAVDKETKSFVETKYIKIKLTIPTASYNALFDRYRKNDNYISGTGLLYIDIDQIDFDPNKLDKGKIFCIYRSIGGLGYSILVKVNNVNPENFKATYQYVVQDLGIKTACDSNAQKLSQQSILSYDPDLFVNHESFIYSSINNNKPEKDPEGYIILKREEEHNVPLGVFSILRYNNINSFKFDGKDYVENWIDGLEYVYCSKPFNPLNDGRKMYMATYVRNLVCLNPRAPKNQIFNSAKFVNLSIALEPLPLKIIEKLVDSILKQQGDGTLLPKITIRRIIFNPKSLMTKDEKLKLQGERQALHYDGIYAKKIYEVIEDWNFNLNGKITIKSVATASGLNIKTIEKRWTNMKAYVSGLNNENVAEIAAFRTLRLKIDNDAKEDDLLCIVADMDVNTLKEQALVDQPDLFDDNDEE